MSEGAYLYILRCADDSYYTGTASAWSSGLRNTMLERTAAIRRNDAR